MKYFPERAPAAARGYRIYDEKREDFRKAGLLS
jgi:hypothetical protein